MTTVLGVTSAEAAPAVANCNGHAVVSPNYVRSLASGMPGGAIQLNRNGNNFIAIFVHYTSYPPPSGFIGNAFLYRLTDGACSGFWGLQIG